MTFRHFRAGFTIVELLIVIVVIGILAALVVSAFSGARDRAENAKTVDVVRAYVKAFTLYASDKGAYPSTSVYPCMGDYADNRCARVVQGATTCGWAGMTSGDASFDAQVAPYLGQKPRGSDQRAECQGDEYVGGYVNANATNTKILTMAYFLKGNVECPRIGGVNVNITTPQGNATRCYLTMPTLQ